MAKFCNCPVTVSKGCVEVYLKRETKKGRIKNCSESHLGRIIRYLSVAYQVSLLKRITPFDVNARPLVCAATINAVDVLQQILISRSSSWLPEPLPIMFALQLSLYCLCYLMEHQQDCFCGNDSLTMTTVSILRLLFVHIGRDEQLSRRSIFKINI